MKIAIIGRTEILYETAIRLRDIGHEISCIVTAKEAPEYTRKASDFRDLAKNLRVPFAQGPNIVEHTDLLRSSAADIAVSINFTGVVPQSVIDIFPFGVLNAHGGDLPRYRGNACQAWAILNGEDRVGLCIHKMIGGELDSGDILVRDYLTIDYQTKITHVWEWMAQRTPILMTDAINLLEKDSEYILEQQSKDLLDALRCYPRRPEDGRIDWSKSALDVLRLINASNKPYTGAFCNYEGQRFTIWDAELIDEFEKFCAVPGQVTRVGDGFVDVVCGDGKLRVLSVGYSGQVGVPNIWISSVRSRLD